MTRACQSCGSIFCDRVACYLDSPSDYPPEEPSVAREPYVPSPEYLAWCRLVDVEVRKTGPNRYRAEAA